VLEAGERIIFPTLVMYEWLRGPRRPEELAAQEALFPLAASVPFGPGEAEVSARLHHSLGRARSREMDIAIAAYAIVLEAPLWTLNRADFEDIPGLRLWD
jgi:predicted nucleic acid-binding protein